jgi:hypothetical protein
VGRSGNPKMKEIPDFPHNNTFSYSLLRGEKRIFSDVHQSGRKITKSSAIVQIKATERVIVDR